MAAHRKLQWAAKARVRRPVARLLLKATRVMAKLLIVEDESATAWAMAEGLKDDGFETATCGSAEDALPLLRAEVPDLVITDLRLPGMSGLALARRLRSGRKPLPVIVVTAFGSPEALAELEECGVHAVFPKPFRVDQLRRSVHEALGS